MIARVCSVLLLLASSCPAQGQVADLVIAASIAPHVGLQLGDEVLVLTEVANRGPGTAQGVRVSVVGVPLQKFPFEIVASETVGCVVESLDIDPVVFNYVWSIGAISAAAERRCVVRLRVRALPAGAMTSLTAQATSSSIDPSVANNIQTFTIGFGAPSPEPIPANSPGFLAAFIVLILGSLAFGRAVRWR